AITISAAATDKVNLRGLLLDGLGSGQYGIVFHTGASLNVQDCLIRNFAAGLYFKPSASNNASSKLSVSNTLVSDNAGDGIAIQPVGENGIFKAHLDRVETDNNDSGLTVNGNTSSGIIIVTLGNSVVANNNNGILATSSSAILRMTVQNCRIAINGNMGVQAQTGSAIFITGSTIAHNGMGFFSPGGGITSYGNNALVDNGLDGSPTAPLPLR